MGIYDRNKRKADLIEDLMSKAAQGDDGRLSSSLDKLSHAELIRKAKAMGIPARNCRPWVRKVDLIEDLMSKASQGDDGRFSLPLASGSSHDVIDLDAGDSGETKQDKKTILISMCQYP